MPADLRLLMEHCWATEPASRPSADRVVECLRAMVQDRQQKLGARAAAQGDDLQMPAAGGFAGDDAQAGLYRPAIILSSSSSSTDPQGSGQLLLSSIILY